MNNHTLIETIKQIVHETCKSETNEFGYGIWSSHMLPVVKFAKQLSKKLNADNEIVEIAALLHDYASVKDFKLYKDHHIHGAIEAEGLLNKFSYPTERIEKIKTCITEHRSSVLMGKTSPESVCVASADAMSHIDNIPSLLHLAYTKRALSIEEGAKWVNNKIERSWNKLCPEAKEIIREKYISAQNILTKDS